MNTHNPPQGEGQSMGGSTGMSRLRVGIAPRTRYPGTWSEMVEDCVELALGSVEFKYERPFTQPGRLSQQAVAEIAQVGRDTGLAYSVHAPYSNLGEVEPTGWRAALDQHLRGLEAAQRIGATTYTVHCGWVDKERASRAVMSQSGQRTRTAIQSMIARSDDIVICLENQNSAESGKWKPCASANGLRRLASEIDGRVAFTLDTGHAHVSGTDVSSFLDALGSDQLRVAHVHDNDGVHDQHLPLGQGSIEWEQFLRLYLERGASFPLLFEMNSMEDFRASLQRLDRLIESVNEELKADLLSREGTRP